MHIIRHQTKPSEPLAFFSGFFFFSFSCRLALSLALKRPAKIVFMDPRLNPGPLSTQALKLMHLKPFGAFGLGAPGAQRCVKSLLNPLETFKRAHFTCLLPACEGTWGKRVHPGGDRTAKALRKITIRPPNQLVLPRFPIAKQRPTGLYHS